MNKRTLAYGEHYRRERAKVLAAGEPCALRLVCDGAPANSTDHIPPLCLHEHTPGSGCCRLQPACLACQHAQGRNLGNLRKAANRGQRPRAPKASRRW